MADNNTIAANIRARAQQQQQNWLRQRQSELEREAALTELHRENGGGRPIVHALPETTRRSEHSTGTSTTSAVRKSSLSSSCEYSGYGHPGEARGDPAQEPMVDRVRGIGLGYGGGGIGGGHARMGGSVGGVRAEEVIDRLTERLTDRLRVELRAELELERNSAAAQEEVIERRVEATLASEVASHTCPVCYELMVPPGNGPVLLFPCGHTFCDACLKQHASKHTNPGKATCPYCRQPIQSKARNVALEQIISSYATRRERPPDVSSSSNNLRGHIRSSFSRSPMEPDSGQAGCATDGEHAPHDSDEVDQELEYTRQLRLISMRCRILANELSDSREEERKLADRRSAAGAVLKHLRSEAGAIEERMEQLRAELEAVRQQAREQEMKADALELDAEAAAAKVALIESTLEPLEMEKAKVRLLLNNVAPGAAAMSGL